MASQTTAQRFLFIDSVRGLAALAVAFFHFYNQLNQRPDESPLWGNTVRQVMTHGYLGVYVFFVLSGFVIACSLHRVRINSSVVGRFALRRSLRLDPTYWTVIWASWFLMLWTQSRGLSAAQTLPGWSDVLANMFYLDNLLGFRGIVKVGWTLCLEIQFYLVFVLVGWLVSSFGGARPAAALRAVVFWPLAIASMTLYAGLWTIEQPGLFLSTWFMYFLGVVTWWAMCGEVSKLWLAGGLVGCVGVGLWTADPAVWAAVCTSIVIYAVGAAGRFDSLLSGSLFRFMGRISYSFYLVHPLVGNKFCRFLEQRLSHDGALDPLLALAIFAAALLFSVGSAYVLYRLIEWPSHQFSRRVRWSTEGRTARELVAPVAQPAAVQAAPTPVPAALEPMALAADDQTFFQQLRSFCSGERRWLAYMTFFVLLCTVELFLVQATTLVYPNEVSPSFAFWAPKIRFALDFLCMATIAVLFWRRLLAVIAIGSFAVYLGLLTYYHYFSRPLSLWTIASNWSEAVELKSFAVDLFPKTAALVLIAALAVKMTSLFMAPQTRIPRRLYWATAISLALGYVSLYAVTLRLDPLRYIQTNRGVGRLGEIRGYLGPWFAEWYYLHDGRLLSSAIKRRNRVYDNLSPVEADIPIHDRLVIVQVESLDQNILGFRADGREVTPFLNKLRETSMYYRVRAIHKHGSSDADFAALNAVVGSEHVNTYTLPGYPYENTTPQLLERCGFDVLSFHGNTGEFYNRRNAFRRIGFKECLFREELERDFGFKADRLGIRDSDVLTLSSQKLRTSTEPTCHFIITLTSHVPYTTLASGESELFPEPRNVAERYMNCIRYVDNCLRNFIVALGNHTTVVLYADHPTEEGGDGFTPDRVAGREYIPCMIYDTDRDLAEMQKTRHIPMSTDGTLNLVDVINYVRKQVARTHAAKPDLPASAAK